MLSRLKLALLSLATATSCDGGCRGTAPGAGHDAGGDALDAGAPTPPRPRLTHGPITGSVRSDSAIVWARAEAPGTLWVEVHGEARMTRSAPLDEKRDNTARVALGGLAPNREYRYRVWVGEPGIGPDTPLPGDEPPPDAPTGRFRTAPAPDDPTPVRIAFGGDLGGQNFCRDKTAGYAIFRSIARTDPALFIGLGDMIYADSGCSPVGRYGNLQWPATFGASTKVEEFWSHYRYNFGDPELAKLLSERAYEAVWDDHEIVNDAGPHNDTRDEPPYASGVHLLPVARQAWLDYAPISGGVADPSYRAVRWGKHVELFFLDTRTYRDDRLAEDTDAKPKTMLGAEQRAWLLDAWGRSDATWRVIVSSVPISIPTGGELEDARDGWASMPGKTGYERELRSLFEAMAQAGERKSLWLSADVHFASAFSYAPLPGKGLEVVELVAGPLAAGIFPKNEYDDTFSPTRLFFHGPMSAESVAGYEEALEWLNYGVLEVAEDGSILFRAKNALDEVLWEKKLER